MVSNASEDLPEPDTPVITVSVLCGIDSVRFLRLCRRAPRIRISPKLVFAVKGIWRREPERLEVSF